MNSGDCLFYNVGQCGNQIGTTFQTKLFYSTKNNNILSNAILIDSEPKVSNYTN